MTPRQIELVRDSLSIVAADPSRFSALFYNRLFAIHPELRDIFPADMGAQQAKFVETLAIVVAALDRLEVIAPDLAAMGARHTGYGTEPHHYEWVRGALNWALGQVLRKDFTLDLQLAWNAAYRRVAEAMQQGAAAPTATTATA